MRGIMKLALDSVNKSTKLEKIARITSGPQRLYYAQNEINCSIIGSESGLERIFDATI